MKRGKLVQYGIHTAVLVGLAVAAVKYLDSDAMMAAFRKFDWRYAPLILGCTLAYMLVKGLRFAYQLRELGNVSRTVVLRGYMASQAATLIPGGFTVRAGILEQAGVPVEDSAASITMATVADFAVMIGVSLVSALWFEAARRPALIMLTVLVVAGLILSIEKARQLLSGGMQKLCTKVSCASLWQRFTANMKEVVDGRTVLGTLGSAVAAFVLMVLALDIAVRGAGAQIGFPTLLLAFALPTLLGWVSPVPGGVGITDAGMVGILDAAPGVTLDTAAAAVVVFRIGTVAFAALAGGVVYLLGWRGEAEQACKTQTAQSY